MAEVQNSLLSRFLTSMNRSHGDFRKSANDNNRDISKIVKDISGVFSSHKSSFNELSSALSEVQSHSAQSAAKIDSTNGLLQQSISIQNSMLAELRSLTSYLKSSKSAGGASGQDNTGLLDKLLPGAGLGKWAKGLAGLTLGAGALGLGYLNSDKSGGAGYNVVGGTEDQKVDAALQTIRGKESGGNYATTSFAEGKGSTASGGYQFTDSTWQAQAKKAGVDIEQYKRAKDAPPEVQDQVARFYVKDILSRNNGDVSAIPREWYTGNSAGKMSDKAIEINRGLTPEKYTQDWMQKFSQNASGMGMTVTGGQTSGNQGSDPHSQGGIKVGGEGAGSQNGMTTLRSPSGVSYTVNEKYAQNFKGFVDELEASGYKIKSVSSYRPGSTIAGTGRPSFHSQGMAIDINPSENPHTFPGQPNYGKTDMPANVGAIAAKYGLGWGGNWQSSKDTMHFSAGASEGAEAGGKMDHSHTASRGGMGEGMMPGVMGVGPMGMGMGPMGMMPGMGMPQMGMMPMGRPMDNLTGAGMMLGGAFGGGQGAMIGGLAGMALGAIGSIFSPDERSGGEYARRDQEVNRRTNQINAINESAEEREALSQRQLRNASEKRNAREQSDVVNNQFNVAGQRSDYNSDTNAKASWWADLSRAFPELQSAVKFSA